MPVIMTRLQENDARDIFYSVANNEAPLLNRPDFHIIRIPKSGLKLSPPSLDFDCGLYVLLRSPTNNSSDAKVPSKLYGKLLPEDDLARWATCPWSLSGPQQSKNSQIQQRYCYPRGQARCSSKGAAIWTQIDGEGKEDINCRIFHVYHSGKRAGTPSPKTQSQAIAQTVKRKNRRGGPSHNKKHKVKVLTAESLGASPAQNMWKSPHTNSFELDSNLDFHSENIFDAEGATPTGHSFSPFVPIRSTDLEERPEQRQAALSDCYDGHYVGHLSRACGESQGHIGYVAMDAPPLPPRHTSTGERRADGGKGVSVLNMTDFAQKLCNVRGDLARDVRGSTGADRVFKLHLLQSWAKGVSEKPLQLTKTPVSQLAPMEGGANIGIHGSPGTPSISP